MFERQWTFVPDMNYSGSITISDVWLWFKWLYFYPGDGVVYFFLNIVPGLGQFLEITYNNYGGTLSGIISGFVWFNFIFGVIGIGIKKGNERNRSS